jgi:aryl-alcohol dehydrogenase-like predicted oxidoreductase
VEQRRLGRTEHNSSVLVVGGAAWGRSTTDEVSAHLDRCLAAGCNSLDIAPSYGDAQRLLGEVIAPVRDRFFLSCKTGVRDADGARRELDESLELHGSIDLNQLQAVTSDEEADAVLGPDGAIKTLLAAKEEGLVRFLGVTGHFEQVPRVMVRLLEQVDFDTVMLPVNASMLALPDYRRSFEALCDIVRERDLGMYAIKAFARRRWTGDPDRNTWYQPWEDPIDQQRALDFVLSLDLPLVAVLPGDVALSSSLLTLAETVQPLDTDAEIHAMRGEPLLASG